MFQVWNDENPENKLYVGYRSDLAKMPTHKVLALPDYGQVLMPYDFVKYDYPLPRNYGQTNSQYNRTAEPVKITLVGDDPEWRTAVANWTESELYFHQPFGLELLLRKPLLQVGRSMRLHYARFLLPLPTDHAYHRWYSKNGEPVYDKRESPFFLAYYVGQSENRLFVNEVDVECAYNANPASWHTSGRRAYTIPADWLSNRIDENKHKYDLFA
jgi:hypothetical protein